MTIYRPFCLSIQTDVEGATAINVPDVKNMGLANNPEMEAELVAQANAPLFVNMKSIKPVFSGETFALKTFLDNVAVRGGKAIATVTRPGITGFWQQFDDNGDAVAGAFQRSLLFKGGVIVPTTLSIDHQGNAQLRWELVPVKSGANAIVVVSDTATLPTITAASNRWTLGAVKINNTALTEYTGLEIDFGNTVQSRGSQSDVYDTHIEVRTSEPTIKLTGIDPTWFSAAKVDLGGVVAAYATDSIYLRNRTQDGSHFVANGTTTHIKFTFGGLAAVDQALRGEAQRIGETTLMIKLAVDGSGNSPLTCNTASAIT